MDLNFKCPLCGAYFNIQDDLQSHVSSAHPSYHYDTYSGGPPIFIGDPNPVEVVAPAAVIATEPVGSPDVVIEPVVQDDGCDCCEDLSWCFDKPAAFTDSTVNIADGCCDCCGDCAEACGDCDCDCECVIM